MRHQPMFVPRSWPLYARHLGYLPTSRVLRAFCHLDATVKTAKSPASTARGANRGNRRSFQGSAMATGFPGLTMHDPSLRSVCNLSYSSAEPSDAIAECGGVVSEMRVTPARVIGMTSTMRRTS